MARPGFWKKVPGWVFGGAGGMLVLAILLLVVVEIWGIDLSSASSRAAAVPTPWVVIVVATPNPTEQARAQELDQLVAALIATKVASAPAASPVVTVTPTVSSVGRGGGLAAAPEVAEAMPEATTRVPFHAVGLEKGVVVIPAWGYGPWGVTGQIYPKIAPNGNVPLGNSQLVTDFDGHNWRSEGKWSFALPDGVTEIWVTTQGDAPAKVLWEGNTLSFWSDAEVSLEAPEARDNAPKPSGGGSTGISLVVFGS